MTTIEFAGCESDHDCERDGSEEHRRRAADVQPERERRREGRERDEWSIADMEQLMRSADR